MNPRDQEIEKIRILGLVFHSGSAEKLAQIGRAGGMVVCPSGPSLAMLTQSKAYQEAMLGADLVIADSGFMALVWSLFFQPIQRVSGLRYLRELLKIREFQKPGSVFWVMPDPAGRQKNLDWLVAQGIPLTEADTYVAPRYGPGPIEDFALLRLLERRKPRQVMVALGGGVQERLAWFLRRQLSYRPGIHCIGAAIAFLSGEQVNISPWADRWFLGWLFRCLSRPRVYVPRYARALRLFRLLFKHRDQLPPVVGNAP